MLRLIVLLDVGGVINDKRQQTAQWQRLVGVYFAPLVGGTSEAWSEAHRIVTEHLLNQRPAIAQAASDFISFHRTYNRYWVEGMCELLSLPVPPEEQCIELAYQAIPSIACRICAALPGAVEAIHILHRQGYTLHTASGSFSSEVAGYLKGMGVQRCFGRFYGADLINTFKEGPPYYERIFKDLAIRPTEALVVDDGSDAIDWAAQIGARTVLVSTLSHAERDKTMRIGSLAELSAFLQQRG